MTNLCDRCGIDSDLRLPPFNRLFFYNFKDNFGEERKMGLCWDCDWDVMNGGDPFEDSTDIYFRRWENEYEYDPVNVSPPPGWGGG